MGIYVSTNSIFVKPVCDDLGFSRGQFTLYRTIITLVSTPLMPIYGRKIRSIGLKKLILISAIGCGLISISYSFSTQLWHFYVLAAFNGILVNGTSFMVIGTLVSGWFHDKKGFATGLAYCGSGLGAAIMVPLLGQVIEHTDWRWGYRTIGIVGMAILVPTVLLLVKESPERMGLEPYRSDKGGQASAAAQTGQDASIGLTMKEALKSPVFWLLAIAFFCISMCAASTNTHTAPYLSDLGYSTGFAASVVSLFMLVLTVGKIVLGYIFDRLGALWGSLFVGICCIGFPILALLAHIPAMPWIYAIVVGMASCGFSVPVNVLITNYFGNKDFTAIFSIFSMVTMAGAAISLPVIGVIYDVTGSYHWAWIMLLITGCIVALCLVAANIMGRKLTRKIEKTREILLKKVNINQVDC